MATLRDKNYAADLRGYAKTDQPMLTEAGLVSQERKSPCAPNSHRSNQLT